MTSRRVKKKVCALDIVGQLLRYLRDVEAGADPIEALHGHICGPDCWHQQLRPKRRSVDDRRTPRVV